MHISFTKTIRQQLCQGDSFIAIGIDHINDKILSAELSHDLPAHTAGRERTGDDTILATADRNGFKFPMTIIDRLKKCSTLAAVGRAVSRILNITTLVHRAILAQQRRTYFITGLRGIGMLHGFFGQFAQLFTGHTKTSLAKLLPGVS